MRSLSLFGGIGALDLALQAYGSTAVAHVEIDPYCRRILRRHWPDVPILPDVREVDGAAFRGVDVICGGFPCTDLSVAGKGAGMGPDTRSGLWWEMLRIILAARPATVVIENSPQLYQKLEWRSCVQGPLEAAGYRVDWVRCSASDVGAPHGRRRAWMLAMQPGVTLPVCAGHPPKGASPTRGTGLAAASAWPTPCARDYRSDSAPASGRGTPPAWRGWPADC